MNALRAIVIGSTCLLLTLASVSAQAKPIEERKWMRMESEHFVVYSMLTRRSTRDVLKHLEVVYAMFLGAAGESTASQVPTTIFAFDGERDAEALGWEIGNMVGFFQPGMSRNLVVILDEPHVDEASVMVHEFVHYLLYNNARFPFPKWYHEGYAEYISANAMGKSYFDVGRIQKGRSWTLELREWLPMEKIIDPAHYRDLDDKEIELFYAQAWLLVHYLYSQPNGQSVVSHSLRGYARSLKAGKSPVDAFEDGFGYSLDELANILKSYKTRGRFQYARFPLDILLSDFDPLETRMSKEEISIELGRLSIELAGKRAGSKTVQLQAARRLFDVAAGSPLTRAQAEIGIGYVLDMMGQDDEAESWVSSGASLASGDYRAQLDTAFFYLARASNGDPDTLAQAEPHLLRASNLDNSKPELAFAIGLFLLYQGELEQAVRAIESAAHRAPADHDTRLLLAFAYAQLGDTERALNVASDILLFPHLRSGTARAAQKLIDELGSERDIEPDPQ